MSRDMHILMPILVRLIIANSRLDDCKFQESMLKKVINHIYIFVLEGFLYTLKVYVEFQLFRLYGL